MSGKPGRLSSTQIKKISKKANPTDIIRRLLHCIDNYPRSISELNEASGIRKNTIDNWRRGISKSVRPSEMVALALTMGVNLNWVLYEKKPIYVGPKSKTINVELTTAP